MVYRICIHHRIFVQVMDFILENMYTEDIGPTVYMVHGGLVVRAQG